MKHLSETKIQLITACNIAMAILNNELEENDELRERIIDKVSAAIKLSGLSQLRPPTEIKVQRVQLLSERLE